MACGAFFDADKVQTGLDVARHFTVQEIQDDFSRGSRLPVPWADRCGGHRNDRGKSVARGIKHFLLREPFGTLVVADHLGKLRVCGFVRLLGTVHGNRGNRAGVNELFHAGTLCGFQKILCAAHVRIVNILRAFGP